MKNIFLYITAFLFIWIFLSQCIIFRNRWSDKKAYRVFASRKIPLKIYDTLIENRHLHYAISGSDSLPTLVFVHGSPGSWMNYTIYMCDTTLQRRFRMISIDRPGFGYSDFGKALHLKEQCKLLLPVLQSLKTRQPMYLCGHSMGGPVAVQLAASDPNLFKTVIIAAGSLDIQQEKEEIWRKVMNVKPLYWLLPGDFAASNTELLYLKKDLIPLQEEFRKITCNVYFIHGDKDDRVPIQNVQYGSGMMVNARSILSDTIFGAGHLFPWKNKEAFTKLLLKLK